MKFVLFIDSESEIMPVAGGHGRPSGISRVFGEAGSIFSTQAPNPKAIATKQQAVAVAHFINPCMLITW
jgi:hypothetical protein